MSSTMRQNNEQINKYINNTTKHTQFTGAYYSIYGFLNVYLNRVSTDTC